MSMKEDKEYWLREWKKMMCFSIVMKDELCAYPNCARCRYNYEV